MVAQYGISVYIVTFRDRYGRRPWTSEKHGTENTYEAIHDYLRSRKGQLRIVGGSGPGSGYAPGTKAFSVARIDPVAQARIIAGALYYGEAGSVRDVISLDTNKTTKTIAENEAPVAPFYYRFDLPIGLRYGVLYLQTTGQIGVKSALSADLKDYFESYGADSGTSISLSPLAAKQAMEAFVGQGIMNEIVLVNEGRSVRTRKALSRTHVGGKPLGELDRIEVKIKRKGGWMGMRNPLKRIARGDADPTDMLKGVVPYDDMKIKVRVGRRTQQFSMIKPDESPIRYDVSGKIDLRSGHPTFTSMDAAVVDLTAMVRGILETYHPA